jgi:tape measure domain-containing protein
VAAGATYRINVSINATNMAPGALQNALGQISSFQNSVNGATSAFGKFVEGIIQPIPVIGGALKGITDAVGGMFSFITSAVTAPIGAINSLLRTFINYRTGVIAAAAVGAMAWPLKLASDLEEAQIAFDQFLGSAEKGTEMLNKLRDFANFTPFTFPELREAAGNLLAVGINAERIIPFMTAIGDAASGLGRGRAGIEAISLDFQRIAAQGRVTARDVMELQRIGVPALKILAEGYGVTTKQIQNWMQNGVLPANRSLRILAEGMESRFGGLMEKQEHTLEGLWSTIEDVINNDILVRFGKGIAGPLEAGMENLIKWFTGGGESVDALAKALELFGNTIGTTVVNGVTALGSSLDKVFKSREFRDSTSFLDMLGMVGRQVFDDLTSHMGSFGVVIRTIVDALTGGFSQVLRELADWIATTGIPALQQFAEWLGPHLKDAIEWIRTTGWPGFHQKLEEFSNWWNTDGKKAFQELADFLGPLFHQFIDWLTHQGLPDLKGGWDKLTSTLQDVWTWLTKVWDEMNKQGTLQTFGEGMQAIVEGAGAIASIFGHAVQQPPPVAPGRTPEQQAAIEAELAKTGGWAQAAEQQRAHQEQIAQNAQNFVQGLNTIAEAFKAIADAIRDVLQELDKFIQWQNEHTIKPPSATDIPGLGDWLKDNGGILGWLQTRGRDAAALNAAWTAQPYTAPESQLANTAEAWAARKAIVDKYAGGDTFKAIPALAEAGAVGEIPLSYLEGSALREQKKLALKMQEDPEFAAEIWKKHGIQQGQAMATGIAEGAAQGAKDSEQSLQDTHDTIQDQLTWSHSPAPYFIDQGQGIIEGLIKGIDENKLDLMEDLHRLVTDMQDILDPNNVLAAWKRGGGAVGTGAGTELTTPQTVEALTAAGLSPDRVADACGLIAAQGVAKGFGDAAKLADVQAMAVQRGDWAAGKGMSGPGGYEDLLRGMGYQAKEMTEAQAQAALQRGEAITLDTPGHYFLATGYNPQTGAYHVGTTGTALRGGAADMTMEQISALPITGGGVRTFIEATKQGMAMNVNQAATAAAPGAGMNMSGEQAMRFAAQLKGLNEEDTVKIMNFLRQHENGSLNPASFYGNGGNTDVNVAVQSGKAFGIGQEMPDTFKSYADPGHGDPTNPLDQALSTINYINKRYGGIASLIEWANRGPYQGYQFGGPILESVFGVGSHSGLPYLFGEGGDIESYRSRMGGGDGGAHFHIEAGAVGPGAVVVNGGDASTADQVVNGLADRLMGRMSELWLDSHGNTPVRRP